MSSCGVLVFFLNFCCTFLGVLSLFLCFLLRNGFKKNDHELMLTIFNSAGVSVFGRENIPSHMCFEEKKCLLLGQKKFMGETMTLPSGKFGENVRIGLFCNKPCSSFVLRKEEFLPSMVAELG